MAAGKHLPDSQSHVWDFLPPRMKVLLITGRKRTGGWLAEALAGDSACNVQLDEAVGVAAGLARLRDEVFDAVLISHEPRELDALDFLEVLRTGSSEQQPILVLGSPSEQELAALCFEVGADAYICVHTTTTRTLLWHLARAVQRHQLLEENRQLAQAQRHQLQRQQDEAQRLLAELKGMLVECGDAPTAPQAASLPPRLVEHYRELLQAHVVMGAGGLHAEVKALTQRLFAGGAATSDVMRLHVRVLEEMLQSLGSRSARHVMNRADLLAMELLLLLAECYRRQYLQVKEPPRQKPLPGFEEAAASA